MTLHGPKSDRNQPYDPSYLNSIAYNLPKWVLTPMLILKAVLLAGVHAILDSECPPCFNCADPAYQCTHFSDCNEAIGHCECISGFGGQDCAEPLCGSLGGRRQVRQNGSCSCDEGWKGINCNMCTNDESCTALVGDGTGATCYTGGVLVAENYHYCNVTNRKIEDMLKEQKAQVTFGCTRNSSSCDLQFWIDELESFYCKFSDCEFENDGNHTASTCNKISCECVPDRMLCGAKNSIDISKWLQESVKGPGNLNCDSSGVCEFNEPAMNQLIKFVFGDSSITLQCDAAECLHYSQIPGYEPPHNSISHIWVTAAFGIVLALLLLSGWTARKVFNRKEQFDFIPTEPPTSTNTVPITLDFQGIKYTVAGKQVLQTVTGSAQPGQVFAIMGGSGAGKTTLLDILAAKNKSGTVGGAVYANGAMLDRSHYNKLVGFVGQDDQLLPTLTVYETIYTSALLRLPKAMSRQTKMMRALDTMRELGIYHLRDSMVGSADHRGLSGGEKRRVAIACELVTSPSVLFLDEPTSGLDAYNAYNVVESLVNLAKSSNRTVIFTIHQPRSNIVSLFDKFLLLAQGAVVFQGTTQQALEHFESLGKPCPPGYNIADYLIDLTMRARQADGIGCDAHGSFSAGSDVDPSIVLDDNQPDCLDPSIHADGANVADDPARQWEDSAYHQQRQEQAALVQEDSLHNNWHATHGLQPLVNSYNNSAYARELDSQIENRRAHPQDLAAETIPKRISIWSQFVILSGRTFKNLYRNPMLVFTHYTISVVLGIFCGILYYQVAFDISGFQNRLGLFFFLLALFGFSTLSVINLFGTERIIFLRERSNGYYHPAAYYCSKVLMDIIPLRVIPPVLLGVIIYPLVGLNYADKAPVKFLAILVLFNLASATTMLVIGILVSDFGVASLVGCLVNLFGILFAGLFLNQESMPPVFGWLKFLSIFHYAYESLSVNEVRYLSLVEKKFGLSIEVPGATILSAFGFDNDAVGRDIAGLGSFAGAFLVLGYVCIYYFLVERR